MASLTTRDHDEIRRWAEQRGATPTVVSRTGGMLRFEFSPESADSLTAVDWPEFFRIFDERGLELVYDDKSGSRFHKFIYPATEEQRSRPARRASAASGAAASGSRRATGPGRAERRGAAARATASPGQRTGKTATKSPRTAAAKTAKSRAGTNSTNPKSGAKAGSRTTPKTAARSRATTGSRTARATPRPGAGRKRAA